MAVEAVFGGEVIWQSEIDKAASKVLAHRWPDVPNLGSITEIDWATVEPVDVLCGGFPCQDVSAAGKRAGIKDGTRSGLWAIFAEAIDALRPQYVVIENVRGLLSAAAHRAGEDDEQSGGVESGAPVMGDGAGRPVLRAAGAVLGDLADLGYDAVWATVAASDVGAPHRRERVFIVANLADADGQRCSLEDDARGWELDASGSGWRCESEGCGTAHEGRPESAVSADEPGVALLPTPRTSDTNGAGHHGDGGMDLLPTPQAADAERGPSANIGGGRDSGAKRAIDLNTVTVRELGVGYGSESVEIAVGEDDGAVPVLAGDGGGDNTVGAFDGDGVAVDVCSGEKVHSACVAGELAGTKHESALLPTPAAADGQRGQDFARANRDGSGGDDLVTLVVKTENGSQWGKYAPAIVRWESLTRPAPAPTEPNKNGNPRLSAAFSEWLMGWPAGWVTDPAIGISRSDQLRIVGNGVCPQQAAAALRYLLAVTP